MKHGTVSEMHDKLIEIFIIHPSPDWVCLLGILRNPQHINGDRGSTVVKVLCYNSEFAGSIPAGVSGFFIDIKSF